MEGEQKRKNSDARRLDLGGKHTIQHTDDVLQNCTPEIYIILLTHVTPINSIKNLKNKRKSLLNKRHIQYPYKRQLDSQRCLFFHLGMGNCYRTCPRNKDNLNPYLISYVKLKSKWIIDLSVKTKAINLLEENIGENHCELVSRKDSQTGYKKHALYEKGINKLDFIKIETFCSFKDTFNKMGENIYKTCVHQKTCVHT